MTKAELLEDMIEYFTDDFKHTVDLMFQTKGDSRKALIKLRSLIGHTLYKLEREKEKYEWLELRQAVKRLPKPSKKLMEQITTDTSDIKGGKQKSPKASH